MRGFLVNLASFSSNLIMNRSTAWRTSRYHLPAFLDEMDHSAVATPYTVGGCPVDPSVVQTLNAPWFKTL